MSEQRDDRKRQALTPNLIVKDAPRAIEFYTRAFAAGAYAAGRRTSIDALMKDIDRVL